MSPGKRPQARSVEAMPFRGVQLVGMNWTEWCSQACQEAEGLTGSITLSVTARVSRCFMLSNDQADLPGPCAKDGHGW